MMGLEDEVWCDVSDDEMYNPSKEKKGTWEPKAEDILKVFEELQSKKVLELHWKCPGRRHPDSDVKEEEETKEEQIKTPVKQEEKKPSIPNEFDFDEDDMGGRKTVLTPRRTPGSAPKSQKKEAKMDKILKDMMQQRKLQAAEREARKLAGNKSPRTPSSPGRARIGSPAGSPRTPNRQSPVRVGAGPADPISTTPLRAPSDPQNAMRLTKNEPNNIGNNKSHNNGSNNFSTSQNTFVQQTPVTASSVQSSAYGNQSTNSGETTTSQAVSREVTSLSKPREVTSSPQSLNQAQQLTKSSESKVESTDIKTEAKDPSTEKMDTS